VEEKPPPRVFDLMAIGLTTALMIGIPLGLGVAVDAWLNSSPIGTLIGLVLGIAAAVGSTVRQLKRLL
jgi:F0F1-type ATP synthase assembly protein I